MQELNVALVSIGGLTVLLSLAAGLLEDRSYLPSEPIAATALGVVLGPSGLDLLHLSGLGEPLAVLEQLARLTMGLAVMAAALRLPGRYFRANDLAMTVVLVPGLVAMWLVSGGLVYALLDVPLWTALLVGAIVTPTDPVLAGTIVTGDIAERYIPEPIRNLLTAESGANDGLAYLLVFLPVLVLEHSPGRALAAWLFETLLWEVGAAVAIGAAVGAAVGWIERESSEHALLEESSLLTITIAFSFAVLGGVKLLGSDGVLAVFVAGLLFNRFAQARDRLDEQKVQEAILRLFTFPVFVAFGLALPWEQWLALGWTGAALAVGILLLRRLPMVFVFDRFVDSVDDRGALFAGWFGPIGIAALFYVTVAHRLIGNEILWTATSLVVASSVLVHGLTASPLTKLFGRTTDRDRSQSAADGSEPEPESAFADG
ncbi:cation:proton antiporter [Halosolutus gelatinilyticus]|uniref:cation:proton antiporter domain-containing protein n=1 Tax=Halosolutus gelatinilyticus TaxID=2931975 RepID=UPI001FF37934|nr:cation:proton antiporter [Halosolutus gelatinilyticus]